MVKNKVAPPFKECEFDIIYGKGISRDGELLDLAVELGIVKKGGAWFSYNDMKLGQGRDNSKDYLLANPELFKEIEKQVRERSGELVMNTKKSAKDSAIAAAAKASANGSAAAAGDENSVIVNADDDFEEFAPVDVDE